MVGRQRAGNDGVIILETETYDRIERRRSAFKVSWLRVSAEWRVKYEDVVSVTGVVGCVGDA